jgi:hypothetical protein
VACVNTLLDKNQVLLIGYKILYNKYQGEVPKGEPRVTDIIDCQQLRFSKISGHQQLNSYQTRCR